jgi:hypothetical protein
MAELTSSLEAQESRIVINCLFQRLANPVYQIEMLDLFCVEGMIGEGFGTG